MFTHERKRSKYRTDTLVSVVAPCPMAFVLPGHAAQR